MPFQVLEAKSEAKAPNEKEKNVTSYLSLGDSIYYGLSSTPLGEASYYDLYSSYLKKSTYMNLAVPDATTADLKASLLIQKLIRQTNMSFFDFSYNSHFKNYDFFNGFFIRLKQLDSNRIDRVVANNLCLIVYSGILYGLNS